MKPIPTHSITLPAIGTWPASQHLFEQDDINAIEMAYYSGRPLLIRGETGSGKSQLARALAHVWGRLFFSKVVNSRTESQDLHYRFDAVARLADAQAASVFIKDANEEKVKTYLNPLKYLNPGVLWWVFDWNNANRIYLTQGHKNKRRIKPKLLDLDEQEKQWQPKDGAVILIDEIDKAETDLPNDLLESLGNGAFTVPWLDDAVCMQEQNPPIVIITTNDERELPAAFVRRCIVLDLNPPREKDALIAWLCNRGRVHFLDQCSDKTRLLAAELLVQNRIKADSKGVSPAGQAEYLDLLRVLCKQTEGYKNDEKIRSKDLIEKRDAKHRELIDKLSPYVYQKYPELKED